MSKTKWVLWAISLIKTIVEIVIEKYEEVKGVNHDN